MRNPKESERERRGKEGGEREEDCGGESGAGGGGVQKIKG